MFEPPYELISCSWPRPLQLVDGQWILEPEWDAPQMPIRPELYWEDIYGELCWMVNWSHFFKFGEASQRIPSSGGEMLGFSIIFRIKIRGSGILAIWDDNRSIMRINGKIIHEDRSTHTVSRCEIEVSEGDELEIAQGHSSKEWLWSARLVQRGQYDTITPADMLLPYLAPIQQQLLHPNGPPLKVYMDGRTPVRAVAAIYSLILNGYTPSVIYLFGENQWSERARRLFSVALPFAQVISHKQVLSRLHSLGIPDLVAMAQQYWFVMKTCISVLYPPEEFCLLDDDVFILDSLDDALAAFRSHDLVYNHTVIDHGKNYLLTWHLLTWEKPHILFSELSTRHFNAGLYWLRNRYDPHWLAQRMVITKPNGVSNLWEQGFIAVIHADSPTFELSPQRYIIPRFDGLPGGLLGYDYEHNPCGFASVHFAGPVEKPSDGMTLALLKKLLYRHEKVSKISASHAMISHS